MKDTETVAPTQESPDFDQIARDLLVETGHPWPTVREAIVEQLRQVWNARGAADLKTCEAVLLEPGDNIDTLTAALRALDR